MPSGLHEAVGRSSPREMAVDVEFHRQEEERWKRHSIAATFDPETYSENSENSRIPEISISPVRPSSMMMDSNIPENENIENINNNNQPPVGTLGVKNQFGNKDHLCRRKSKSISNFGDQVLTSR